MILCSFFFTLIHLKCTFTDMKKNQNKFSHVFTIFPAFNHPQGISLALPWNPPRKAIIEDAHKILLGIHTRTVSSKQGVNCGVSVNHV